MTNSEARKREAARNAAPDTTGLRKAKGWSDAERRMIRRMTKKGGKGFRVLRSAEMPLKRYSRHEPDALAHPDPTPEPSSADVWDECVRTVAGVDPAAIHNPYRDGNSS